MFSQVERGQGNLCIMRPVCLLGLSQGRYSAIPVVSLSHSLILLNLLISSSWSSVAKQRSSPTWAHLPQVCSLLPPSTGVRAGHTVQLDTWVAACSCWNSVWEAVSVVVGAELREARAFCQVDTIAPWSSWQSFSTLPAWPSTQTAMPCPC